MRKKGRHEGYPNHKKTTRDAGGVTGDRAVTSGKTNLVLVPEARLRGNSDRTSSRNTCRNCGNGSVSREEYATTLLPPELGSEFSNIACNGEERRPNKSADTPAAFKDCSRTRTHKSHSTGRGQMPQNQTPPAPST